MSTSVIHFSTLGDFLGEFDFAQVVRVSINQRTEVRNTQHFPRKIVTVCVHVRALADGCILSYMPFAHEIEMSVMTQHDSPSPQDKYENVWKDAERVSGEIRAAIGAAGHEVRSGTIDLGGVDPVQGEEWVS